MYQVGTRDAQNGASPGGIDSLERVILKKIYYYDKETGIEIELWTSYFEKVKKGQPRKWLPSKGAPGVTKWIRETWQTFKRAQNLLKKKKKKEK